MKTTNGNTDQPGDPVSNMLEGSDGQKLAMTRKALKKKLLRVLLQQAIDEMQPDDVAEEAISSGLIDAAQLESVSESVRAALVARLGERAMGSDPDALIAEVTDSLERNQTVDETSSAVTRRIVAEIGESALAKLGDAEETVAATYATLVEANGAVIDEMADSVRERLIDSVIGRVVESTQDPERIAEMADEVSNRLQDEMVSRVVTATQALNEDTLIKLADERLESSELMASAAADRIRNRLVEAVVRDANAAGQDADAVSASAWEAIDDRESLVAPSAELVKDRLVQHIADEACKQLGSAKKAAELAEDVAQARSKVVDKAVRVVFDGVARTVAETVGSQLEDADTLAEASADYVDLKDPRIADAVEQLRVRLSERLAMRVVSVVSDEAGIERLAVDTETAHADTLLTAEEAVQEAVMTHIMDQVGRSFIDAGDTARRAKERLGSTNATIIAAGEVLKELVLEDMAKQATFGIIDPAKAAEKAFERIDPADPRFVRATDSLRATLLGTIAELSLQGIESNEGTASEARALIPSGHEYLVGAAAVLREMLVDDIAKRSEDALRDTRKVAEQSHGRVPTDSPIIADASERLRLLLIEDMVAMTTKAMEDARVVAEDALKHVNNEDEVLQRARAVFKEQVLVNVLGEAIREINANVAPGKTEGHQAIFNQALNAMTQPTPVPQVEADVAIEPPDDAEESPKSLIRQNPPPDATLPERTRPAPKAPDRPPVIAQAPPVPKMPRKAPVPVAAAKPAPVHTAAPTPAGKASVSETARPSIVVDEPPSWDDHVAVTTPPPVVVAPPDGWVKLSDMDSDDRFVALDEPTELESPIETEILEAGESASDAFSWDFDLLEDATDEIESDVAADSPSSARPVDMTWDADDGTRCYVYGFVAAADLPTGSPPKAEGIDASHPVKTLTVRELRAIVSKVSAEDFGSGGSGRKNPDPSWIKQQVRSHARVLDTLDPACSVIPVKFGTVWDNEAAVAEMITARYDELTASLERLRDKKEWGIRVTRNVDRLRARLLKSGRAVEDSLDSISAGVAQFVKDELAKAGELDEEALTETVTAHCLRRAHHALEQWSAEGVRKPFMDQPGVDLVMNAAYLIESTSIQDFRTQLDRLTADFEALGFSFDLSGPWPPYHFVNEDFASVATPSVHQ